MKQLTTYLFAAAALTLTSACSDFLDTTPHDSLPINGTWKTETDAEKFLIGCYDGWADETGILYWDCASDFGFNFHTHEGFTNIGNGRLTASNAVANYYNFTTIHRCNDFLEKITQVPFSNEAKKNNMIGQVRTIRAYRYFLLNQLYGGVPIVGLYKTAKEAKQKRNTEEEVKKYLFDDIDAAISLLPDKPEKAGLIAKGTALALDVRASMFYAEYERAKKSAQALMDLGIYELEPQYATLFTLAGQGSKEIIAAVQHDENLYSNWMIATMYNNADGGWSSMVPTSNLVDAYEMKNGLTKDEAGSGYDAKHPFANRDPRMAMTILYPGMDWVGRNGKTIINTLDATIDGKKNPNHSNSADNASKTGLTWAKYLTPMQQYADVWSTKAQPIIFRYAEVLLSYAEAENELNGPSPKIYELIDKVRTRAGMPKTDKAKYSTKEKLRELIRRERSVELAGEGLRRMDIIRWKDAQGKMLAETVLNGPLNRIEGTVNNSEKDPTLRATITATTLVEQRTFKPTNKYLPIPQSAIDKNDELEQNPGY